MNSLSKKLILTEDEQEESEKEDLKRQNFQLIEDVNMLVRSNVELKSLL